MDEISDFDDDEFYGLLSDFEQRKANVQEELRNGIGSNAYAISTLGENTEGWQEEKLNLEEKKEELSNRIELSFGFAELRTILGNFEEDKMRKGNQEAIRQESVECQLHTIQEEIGNDFGAAISGI